MEQRISNLDASFSKQLSTEFSKMKEYVDLEMGKITRNMELLDKRVREIESTAVSQVRPAFDPEYTIVAINWREEPGEDIASKAERLVEIGLGLKDLKPRRVTRLQ